MHLNIEIKARSNQHDKVRQLLLDNNANYKGTDHQIDTYFNSQHGRLKLRQGNIENSLIQYSRTNQAGPKASEVYLYNSSSPEQLLSLLDAALGTKTVVDKQREIYFIANVKFHIDHVQQLGSFIEIEAIDKDGTIGIKELHRQCQYYIDLFGIQDDDLINNSYSDMLLAKDE